MINDVIRDGLRVAARVASIEKIEEAEYWATFVSNFYDNCVRLWSVKMIRLSAEGELIDITLEREVEQEPRKH